MIGADAPVLKTDTKGRVHTPPARREQLLDEFERSGLSGTKFAELAGLKYQTFAAWAARRTNFAAMPWLARKPFGNPVAPRVFFVPKGHREHRPAFSTLGTRSEVG